jgi:hypothetical protein
MFAELARAGKCVVLDHAEVDEVEHRIRDAEPSPDFDDAHLIAMFDVSGCLVLCSADGRSDRFVKDRRLYERHKPPRIYRERAHHLHLLSDENIARCCQPPVKLTRENQERIQDIGPQS